jgi:uncharacterized protein (DUF488 family)
MMGSYATTNVFTIGHSNLQLDQFLARLKAHGVSAIVDVRSVPFSRRFPWFSSRTLAERLKSKGIDYVMMGDSLGGRPFDPSLYANNTADYEAMAATADFRLSIDHLCARMMRDRLCLMCAEGEPLDCHRCLLVGRALADRGCQVGHIRSDGTLEPHAATEERLLAEQQRGEDLFTDRAACIADAYRERAARIAARLSDRVRPGRTPKRAIRASMTP